MVELSVIVEGASDNVETPRLPDLPDFRIMSGPNTSTSVSIVNFNMTKSVTYAWRLNPLKTGTLAIPSFQVKIGDKVYPTQPLTLKAVQGSVRPQQQGRPVSPFDDFFGQQEPSAQVQGEVKVRAVPDKATAYVGEPIVLTYELLTQAQVNGLAMDKVPAYTGFWVEPVELPRQPQARLVEMDGKRYQSIALRKDILYPSSPGDKPLEEASFRLQVMVPTRDFFGFGRAQEIIRKTAPLTLHILDLPAEGRPPGFLGAVGEFSASSSTDKVEVEEGEAFALRFTVKGRGNLKTIPAPILPVLPDCKVYDPKVEEKVSVQEGTLTGSKTWEWIVVPASRQLLKVPSIAFAAFDPRKKTYIAHSTQTLSVYVKPGKGTASTPVVLAGGEEVKTLGKDIAFIATEESPLRRAASPLYARWWFTALLLLPLLGNLSLLVLRKQREKMLASGDLLRSRRAKGKAAKRLAGAEKALKAGDADAFFKEIRGSLVGLVADRSARAEEGLTFEEMASMLKDKGAGEETLGRLQHLLQACDMARYAPAAESRASREALLKHARSLLEELEALK
jgi:hypothetical protein